MTTKQRIYFMSTLWPAACRAQKWSPNDRARRIDVLSRILGRDIKSANEIATIEDFDLVKRELRTLADDLRGPLDNQHEAEGRRLLNVIREEIIPCLALYCDGFAGARAYVSAVIQDKFNKNRRVEKLALEDLSPHPNVINGREIASQIQQLLYTLNSRLNGKHGLRNKAGDSVAEMRRKAFHVNPDEEPNYSSAPPEESFETAEANDPW